MIAPAYATAHMSQILIEPEERNRSCEHFRCVPRRFPISVLWEFNLIPADVASGAGFQEGKKKQNQKERNKKGRLDLIFLLVQENQRIWVSLFLSVSVSHSQMI